MPGLGLGLSTVETGRSGRRDHAGRGLGWCPELRVNMVGHVMALASLAAGLGEALPSGDRERRCLLPLPWSHWA